MFTNIGQGGYVAEKAEGDTGWLFPVGDEVSALGYLDMFMDMFNAMDSGQTPMETFYDGYIVNAIIDASYKAAKTKKWEPIAIQEWRGSGSAGTETISLQDYDQEHYLIKEERMPNGNLKIILKNKQTGEISQVIKE
jgi:hypothetical protein